MILESQVTEVLTVLNAVPDRWEKSFLKGGSRHLDELRG